MAKRVESFHPDEIIDEHFRSLINQIDIMTETMLQDESLSSEKRNELNTTREKQINKIDETKLVNLKNVQDFNEEEYAEKWLHLIDDTSLEYEQKIDLIKEKIISIDCVLLKNERVLNGYYMWITPWFYNLKNLNILR